jgi:hypothetical protein
MSEKDLDDPGADAIAQVIDTIDLGYGAVPPDYTSAGYGADTITLNSGSMYTTGPITLPTTTITNGSYAIGNAGSTLYTTGTGSYGWTNTTASTVNISNTGIDMAAGTDITVAGKSLKQFMDKMEERLAILVPDPAKLEKFEALKRAYEHYKLMEKLCQEETKED